VTLKILLIGLNMVLQLGNQTFSSAIIQGPLAGVSTAPFRELIWRYSQPAYCATEMISCKTLLHASKQIQKRYITKSKVEGAVSFQLSGNDPSELAEATKIATDCGADLIDLNCGCPVKKIRSKGAGSKLLSEPQRLYQLIRAMKDNTTVPVSIKIRVDGGSDESFNDALITMLNEAGSDFVVVHGRHWTEHYETPCRYDQIAYFVERLAMPVIGNGDIACAASLKKMLATGCAGVMIGRAGVGQPWLIAKLMAEINGEQFELPTNAAIREMFLTHVDQLAELLHDERIAVREARQFAKYYARTVMDRDALVAAVNRCESLTALREICSNLFI
jgi:tRNA-dihydrouridine synthase B